MNKWVKHLRAAVLLFAVCTPLSALAAAGGGEATFEGNGSSKATLYLTVEDSIAQDMTSLQLRLLVDADGSMAPVEDTEGARSKFEFSGKIESDVKGWAAEKQGSEEYIINLVISGTESIFKNGEAIPASGQQTAKKKVEIGTLTLSPSEEGKGFQAIVGLLPEEDPTRPPEELVIAETDANGAFDSAPILWYVEDNGVQAQELRITNANTVELKVEGTETEPEQTEPDPGQTDPGPTEPDPGQTEPSQPGETDPGQTESESETESGSETESESETEPGSETNPGGQPGQTEPGQQNPGGQPGQTEPNQPGETNPGGQPNQPGQTEPGQTNPGGQPGQTEPNQPEETNPGGQPGQTEPNQPGTEDSGDHAKPNEPNPELPDVNKPDVVEPEETTPFDEKEAPSLQVSAPLKGSSYVKFEWTPVKGADGYEIIQVKANGERKLIAVVMAEEGTVYEKEFSYDKKYRFEIRAFQLNAENEKIYGKYGEVRNIRTPVKELKKPGGLNVTAKPESKQITVTWESVPEADGYQIFIKTGRNGEFKRADRIEGGTVTSCTLTKKHAKTYTVRVAAYKNNKKGRPSVFGDCSSEKSITTAPAKTKNAALKSKKKAQVTVTWRKVARADGYRIYRSTSKNGKYTMIKNITKGGKVKYTVKAKSGKKYYYKVRAYVKAAGGEIYGAYSAPKGIKAK